MRSIDTLIIHCAYTKSSMNIGVDEIRQWHLGKGWSDIGYHFVIRRSGAIETGRSVEDAGAHAKGHNQTSIGVCLVGGMSNTGDAECNFTRSQWKALEALTEALVDMHGIDKVIGHNQVSEKICPCFDVSEWWSR